MGRFRISVVAALVSLVVTGCATKRVEEPGETTWTQPTLAATSDRAAFSLSDVTDAPAALSAAAPHRVVEAMVVPPAGWRPDPIKRSKTHAHPAWVSPSGKTAYGVIRINLPLPFIGPDVVLRPFMDEMRQTEGAAKLVSRKTDRRLPGPGIRFVAEGGQYTIRTNLMTRGFRAWAVYAGTRRGEEEVPAELELAEQARERTKIGLQKGRR